MGLPDPSRETKFSGANADSEILFFPVQLTTSRIGNLTRLIHTVDPYSAIRDDDTTRRADILRVSLSQVNVDQKRRGGGGGGYFCHLPPFLTLLALDYSPSDRPDCHKNSLRFTKIKFQEKNSV